MGLYNRFKKVRDAEKRKKKEGPEHIDVDELDEFDLDAGDALEAEVQAELEREKRARRRR